MLDTIKKESKELEQLIEQIKKETKDLERRGIILAEELQNRLIALKVFSNNGRYYLEDILAKIMPSLAAPHSAFFKILYLPDKSCSIILENGRLESETIRAESNCFVNAAGKFLIEAIERGFVRTNWQDLLEKGLMTSEYQLRSNLMIERNLIKSLLETYTKRPQTLLEKIKKYFK
jgi:hypothetical protein